MKGAIQVVLPWLILALSEAEGNIGKNAHPQGIKGFGATGFQLRGSIWDVLEKFPVLGQNMISVS